MQHTVCCEMTKLTDILSMDKVPQKTENFSKTSISSDLASKITCIFRNSAVRFHNSGGECLQKSGLKFEIHQLLKITSFKISMMTLMMIE